MHGYWLNLVGFVGAVFLFGFAVLVHELGHFLAAKRLGVGVKRFALGFGPKIWSIRRGGTEYSLRWIPVGGFVSLKGMIEGMEDEDEPDAKDKEKGLGKDASDITSDLDALRNKHPLARIGVFAAGVSCNYLTAILLTGVLLWYGMPKLAPLPNVLEEIPASSQLYALGWRSGDRIVAVGKTKTKEWDDVVDAVIEAKIKQQKARGSAAKQAAHDHKKQSGAVVLTVQRGATTLTLPLPFDSPAGEEAFFLPPCPPQIGAVMPNSPADRAKLIKDNYRPGEIVQPMPTAEEMKNAPLDQGDLILAINDQPVQTWRQMQKILHANPDKPVALTVRRGKGRDAHTMRLLTVLEASDENGGKGRLGIYQGRREEGRRERLPFFEAFAEAPVRTLILTYGLVVETARFIRESSWRDTQRNVGGPMAIGIMAYKSARKGLGDYLQLFVAISIILAVMNLLPIPVLDGGYIAITLVEVLIRRPIPQKVLVPILTTFMFAFMVLFALLFYNDFKNWVFKW